MAYDEALAQRLRHGLRGVKGVSEKRMMGGLCVLVHGNMLGGVDRSKAGSDRFMFRVGKDNEAEALGRPGATIVAMGGKRLGGLVFVDAEACDGGVLREWIALALGFVGNLPKK
jgi:TfoX/Sxy family transcriptional regulator of competence genes